MAALKQFLCLLVLSESPNAEAAQNEEVGIFGLRLAVCLRPGLLPHSSRSCPWTVGSSRVNLSAMLKSSRARIRRTMPRWLYAAAHVGSSLMANSRSARASRGLPSSSFRQPRTCSVAASSQASACKQAKTAQTCRGCDVDIDVYIDDISTYIYNIYIYISTYVYTYVYVYVHMSMLLFSVIILYIYICICMQIYSKYMIRF